MKRPLIAFSVASCVASSFVSRWLMMPRTRIHGWQQGGWGAVARADSEKAYHPDLNKEIIYCGRPSHGEAIAVSPKSRVEVARGLDKIPRLMYQLHDGDYAASEFCWHIFHDQYSLEKERRRTPKNSYRHPQHLFEAVKLTRSTTPRDHDGRNHASPPAPPQRALELVKEEVNRALKAFSTRPLKGFTCSPRPSDLLRPFDVCKDARVTYPEFYAGLRGLGVGLTADESESLAREVDNDDTGLVDRKMFETAAVERWGRDSTTRELTSDPGQKGFVSDSLRKHDAPGVEQRAVKSEYIRKKEWQNSARDIPRDNDHLDRSRGVVTRSATPGGEINPPHCTGKYNSRGNNHDRGAGVFPGKKRTTESIFSQDQYLPPPSFETGGSATKTPRVRGGSCSPTVSFNQWRRMTRRWGSVDETRPSAVAGARGNGHIVRRSLADETSWNADRNGRASQRGCNLVSTLRSLLVRDDFSDEAIRRSLQQAPGRRGWGRHIHGLQRQKNDAHAASSGAGKSKEARGGADRRNTPSRGEPHSANPSSVSANVKNIRGRGEENASTDEGASKPASALDLSRAYASRAEKTLMLRSRGDLVGLRRAFSRADLSASGVLSSMEMERSILRRFGAGLGDREARALAAQYRVDYRGHNMVDYVHLLDNLEAREAGLTGEEVEWERPRRDKVKSHDAGTMDITMPEAAGFRPRTGHRRYSKKNHDATESVLVGDVPLEKSQLVRRARNKTLALLDQHGTRSIDRVFGFIDNARTGIVNAEEFRDGLRVLSGTDPLSDIEYKVLFRDVCTDKGRIKYRDLTQTLRAAKAKESWESTQRKMARQAELPSGGRGSGIHLRHSKILDYIPENDEVSVVPGLSGGRRHMEWRRRALVLQRLRDRVKKIQGDRNGAGPLYEMFQRQGGAGKRDTAEMKQSVACKSPSLHPLALRRGLSSLGVPLGDDDFVAIVAAADPDRRGEVSYVDFYKSMWPHQLRDDHGVTTEMRPTSTPPSLSSQSFDQDMSSDNLVSARNIEKAVQSENTRQITMDLAPPADMNLDGGIFHRNPATDGCTNPNFTTTMINSWVIGKYRSKRRQPPTRARSSPHTLPGSLVKNGPFGVEGRSPQRWSETSEEAEVTFRRRLGMKMRRPHSYSSAPSFAKRHESCGGWDSIGILSPRQAPVDYAVDGYGHGNLRGRAYTPKNNDLGFGSERMRSDSMRGHRYESLHSWRRSRSLSLDANMRYGHRARSTVQHLLRDDSWLEVHPGPAPAPENSTGGFFADRGGTSGLGGHSETGWHACPGKTPYEDQHSKGIAISRRPLWNRVPSACMQGEYCTDGSENTGVGDTRAQGRSIATTMSHFQRPAPRGYDLRQVVSEADALSFNRHKFATTSEVFKRRDGGRERVSQASAPKRPSSAEACGRGQRSFTVPWSNPRSAAGDENPRGNLMEVLDSKGNASTTKRWGNTWS